MERTDNIETISTIKKNGSLSFGYFTDMVNMMGFMAVKLKMMKQNTYDSIMECINLADLNNVDFKVKEFPLLEDDLEYRFNDFMVEGADEKYKYLIYVSMNYPEEDMQPEEENDEQFEEIKNKDFLINKIEPPESTSISITRMEIGKPEAIAQFDYEKKSWIQVDIKKATGYTQKQVEILKSNNAVKIEILMGYKNMFGPVSDKRFRKLLSDNDKIINLYKQTSRFMKFSFYDKNTIILNHVSCCPGSIVRYKDGQYTLDAGTDEYSETVFQTDDEEHINIILENMYDRVFYDDTIAIIPLSEESLAIVRQNGSVEYLHPFEKKGMEASEKEKGVLKRFFESLE